MILEMNDWNVENFILLKIMGTVVVISFMLWLYDIRSDMGMAVAVGVSLWQIFLVLFYLGIGDICAGF